MNRAYNKIYKFFIVIICCMAISWSISGDYLAIAEDTSKGVNTDYHTKEEIIDYISQSNATIYDSQTYAENYSLNNPVSQGKLSAATLKGALDMVNQIRYIAGLPSVTLDNSYNEKTQIAALIGAMNGTISHSPKQPAGMSNEMFEIGYTACGQSNLSMGRSSLNYSIVDGFMGDYTGNNVEQVGHRRWILNPDMGKTGFGAVASSYVMYSIDRSASKMNASYNGVAWPARQMPLAYFASASPWSYSYGSAISNPQKVAVKLVDLTTGKEWNFSNLSSDGDFNVSNDWYAQPGCIIFRPKDARYSNGKSFKVTITGLPTEVEYTVTFFSTEPSVPTDEINLGSSTEKMNGGAPKYYKFTAPCTGKYSFYSTGMKYFDNYGALYADDTFSDASYITGNDDINMSNGNWHFGIFGYEMQKGETVYLLVRGYSSSTNGDFTLNIDCDEILEIPAININGASLTMEGQIGVNFFVDIPDIDKALEGAYIKMTYTGDTTKPMQVLLKDGISTDNGYKFTFPVAVKEICDKVSLQAYTADGEVIPLTRGSKKKPVDDDTFKYAVIDYLNDVPVYNSSDTNLVAFAQSLVNYGAEAQNYFKHNAGILTSTADYSKVTSATLQPYDATKSGTAITGLKVTGVSLTLESELIMNVSFSSSDAVIDKTTFKVNGKVVKPTKQSNATYKVEVPNIAAKDLDEFYTVEYTDGTNTQVVKCCPLGYAYTVIQGSDEGLKTLVKAMYLYNQAANAYFHES